MSENELFRSSLAKAMALCSRREYCISDIQAKLNTWGISNNDCLKIINQLKKENFLNEERFAGSFVKDKFTYNKWGRVKISTHLKAKKIPSEIINKAFETISYDSYKKMLNDLLSSHRRLIKAKNQCELKAKLLRYGLSKGFESSLLYEILNDMEE
jgi:regulatory protein